MKKITMEYYGFTGSGATLKEAKADASRQLAEAMEGDYTPRLVSWRGWLALITREPKTGWGYRLIYPDKMTRPVEIIFSNSFSGDRTIDATLYAVLMHLADLGRKTGEHTSELLEMVPRGRKAEAIREFESRAKGSDLFQARYREAKAAGLPDGTCHQYACSHGWIATLEEFRAKYPEAVPA